MNTDHDSDSRLQRQVPTTQPTKSGGSAKEKGEAGELHVGGQEPRNHGAFSESSFLSKEVVAPAIRARPQQAVDEALVGKGEGDDGKQLCLTERVGRNEGKTVLLLPVQHPCIHEGLGRNADHVVVVNGHQMKAERSDDHAHR